jgi:hypothetical protein
MTVRRRKREVTGSFVEHAPAANRLPQAPTRERAVGTCLSVALASVFLVSAEPVAAEEWRTNLTAYLLVPWVDFGVQTSGGATVDASADPGDVFESLDFGFMLAGDTRKGKTSLLYDVMYTDLGSDGTLSGPLSANVDVDLKMLLASFAVGYDVQRSDTSFAQVFGGARYVALENTTTLTGGGPVGAVVGINQDVDYFEPLIGVRGRTRVSDRMSLGGYVNVGGFGAGSELTWDTYVGLDYVLSDRMSANFGVRYISIDYEADNADIDMDMYGPVMGLTWRF